MFWDWSIFGIMTVSQSMFVLTMFVSKAQIVRTNLGDFKRNQAKIDPWSWESLDQMLIIVNIPYDRSNSPAAQWGTGVGYLFIRGSHRQRWSWIGIPSRLISSYRSKKNANNMLSKLTWIKSCLKHAVVFKIAVIEEAIRFHQIRWEKKSLGSRC